MESLKAVGKAIRNSPRAIRKKLGTGQHEKLDEDWYHSEDPVKNGVSFYVKYLGSTEVTRTHGTGSTDDAVKRIVHHAKGRGVKLQKVQITISSKFLRLVDAAKMVKLDELPLYRVSYCTVDPYYDNVFCYIARNSETKKLDCHAFLCAKKSKAEAITLTVAQAFNIAYERWQKRKAALASQGDQSKGATQQEAVGGASPTAAPNGAIPVITATPETPTMATTPESLLVDTQPPPVVQVAPPRLPSPPRSPTAARRRPHSPARALTPPLPQEPVVPQLLVGLDSPVSVPSARTMPPPSKAGPFVSADDTHLSLLSVKSTIPKAISLDYLSLEDDCDVEFSRLAEARSNPQLLAIGDHINRQDMRDDVLHHMLGDKSMSDISQSRSHDDLMTL